MRCSFPPSSDEEVLRRRRLPAFAGAGDGALRCSTTAAALGRSLGSAEEAAPTVLGRSDVPPRGFAAVGVTLASDDFIASLSVPDRVDCCAARRRVTILVSGVTLSRLLGWARGRLSPPIEARGAEMGWGVTDDRRAFFVTFVSSVLASLLLTPAIIALPTEARFNWRRDELLVFGLLRDLGLPPGWTGSDMVL